ncbi:uncharacterized protein N0V89_012582 [Didymosphaeria variabile]|uniref:5-Methylcytosine G/T mismatch-specific DNA glycosylase n=1 Tax=Didymosphaeria variabile TaxID=1932322 RepID=A0A9W8X9P7_9PLEO|nr:uncharacterized protein N0V89_012582 [Didymosphaeria variabile]KAJ4344838.1 hypothetical protein N0V89_012582 [Didymosphaeria variabile]
MLSSSESSRRRKKDPEGERKSPKSKDRDREKDKDRERHRSSKSSRSSGSTRKPRSNPSKEDVTELGERPRPSSTSAPKSHKMAVVPEMERRSSMGTSSLNGSRTSLGYPTLSRTHAKENIYKREGPVDRTSSPFTPEPTDVDDEQKENKSPPAPTRAPPSPPVTASNGADLRKTASRNSMRRNADELHREMASGRQSVDSGTRLTPDPRTGAASRSSIRDADIDSTEFTSTTSSQPSTVRAKSPKAPPTRAPPAPPKAPPPRLKTASPSNARASGTAPSTTVRARSRQASEVTQSTGSDFTSVLPERQPSRRVDPSPTNSEVSPDSVMDSSPRTPTQHSAIPTVLSAKKVPERPFVEIITDPLSRTQSVDSAYNESPLTPPPPPPPPAMMDPPRVDYLLQNGGLKQPVPRTLLAAMDGTPVPAYSQYMSPRVSGPQTHDARTFFNPLQKLLDDYNAVMDTSGSLAVATGYRSIARRLLDRLEAVFARNISSEECPCIMCLDKPIHEDQAGVNWGEILELVSGRCDLPPWPPVSAAPSNGLGIADLEPPCQRIDVDVPEQYREHYQQQSRKTKTAVQSWLSNQQEAIPEDADDETLTFAMLTRLDQTQRPLFYAVLWGMDIMPHPRATKDSRPTPPYITKAALALQRLYRLYSPPRDQLVVMYMLRNPDTHNTLATLSAVTKHEWEILVSGRFDGFLWSGAEPSPSASRTPSGEVPTLNGPQRFASPFGAPMMSPRPGSARPGSARPGTAGPAPVQIDEETEIAVLAEVEREIYLGMEAMEDAFEALHVAAENVRRRMRERGAALSMVAQARRPADIEVRMGTPASVVEQEGLGDERSEIGPDDSASNEEEGASEGEEVQTPATVEEDGGSSLAERVRRKY